jgi:hypothetical protein
MTSLYSNRDFAVNNCADEALEFNYAVVSM